MRHVVYIGPHKSLAGKMALARPDESSFGYILVQFDDVKTGLGYGWRALPAHHFNRNNMPLHRIGQIRAHGRQRRWDAVNRGDQSGWQP